MPLHSMKRLMLFAVSITMLNTVPSMAAQSPWSEGYGGKMRLVAGGRFVDGLKAGLEIEMEPGWKTYWKVPGDAGIPPTLDFSASTNVKNVEILWPAPTRYGDNVSQLLGYKDWVTFPIRVIPQKADQAVNLVLDANVGLCSDLCVPVQANLSLFVPAGGDDDGASEFVIDRDLALVPGKSEEGFRITNVIRKKGLNAPDQLIITTDIPKGMGKTDLFVEGPTDWYLPLPQPMKNQAGQFRLGLEGLPKEVSTKNVELIFTLTNGEKAVEQTILLTD